MLEELVPNIQRTADLVQEISASTREQNIGAEQINDAIRELDRVIQQNAASADSAASTSVDLASRSDDLQRAISFFKVDASQPVPRAAASRDAPIATDRKPGAVKRPPQAPAKQASADQAPSRENEHPTARDASANKPSASHDGFDPDLEEMDISDQEFQTYQG